jgi:NAD(P)-dependent dehydrogenase (short-subunit alcohol dehydrogenase family)
MTKDMENKVALVTGGSSGIGRATALTFAARGATVVIASRARERGEQVVAEIESAGGKGVWVQTDVSQAAQVEALFKTCRCHTGAGLCLQQRRQRRQGRWVADIHVEDWDATIDGFLKVCGCV